MLFKLVRGVCRLETEMLSLEDAVKLYRALMRGIKDAVSCLSMSQAGSKNPVSKAIKTSKKHVNLQKQPIDMRIKRARIEGEDYMKDTRKKRIVN
jgi:exonuclease VII small subunit